MGPSRPLPIPLGTALHAPGRNEESKGVGGQLRTDVRAQNKWITTAIVKVASAFQHLRKIRPRQQVLLSSFQGERRLALTFWIVLQAVQDQLPDLARREAAEWTWIKKWKWDRFSLLDCFFLCVGTPKRLYCLWLHRGRMDNWCLMMTIRANKTAISKHNTIFNTCDC